MKKILILVIVMMVSFVMSTLFFFSSGVFDFDYGYVTENSISLLGQNVDNFLSVKFIGGTCNTRNINESVALDLSSLKELKVSSLSTDVVVYRTDSEYATFYLRGYGCDQHLINYRSSGIENVYIEYPVTRQWFSGFGNDLVLEAYIPYEYDKKISIDSVSGDVYLDSLDQDECVISSISGDVEVSDIYCDDSSIKTVSGDIDVYSGSFDLIKTTSGDVDLVDVLIDDDSRIETVSGDVEVSVNENSSFDVIFNSISGDLDGISSYADKESDLFVKTVSGDLHVSLGKH